MKVYKVLLRENRHLISAFIAERKAVVRYRKNIPTRPKIKGSLLAAFRTLRDAQFFGSGPGYCVYLAEAKVSREDRIPDCRDVSFMNVEDSWSKDNRLSKKKAYWPQGTVLCTEITILERIDQEEVNK